MFKPSKTDLLLFLIILFSFVYRISLMLIETYPPGADIGLHNSLINSITQSGNTDFLFNYYHMGGGSSLTFPGYHIFVADIIFLTGIPEYLVHALVSSLFSSLTVAVAFLITKKVWSMSSAFIVAFLAAVSRFDIEMLMWGGYPNVVALTLISIAFYLFIQRERFPSIVFLFVASFLSATIFLTHSLSAIVYVAIILTASFFVIVFSRQFKVSRTRTLFWLTPLLLGTILVSPFLINAVPAYLGANLETFTGNVTDVRLAILSTQTLPLDFVFLLLVCFLLIFFFSKKYKGSFFAVSPFLVAMWILVPTLLSQGYLLGFYTNYTRFAYFAILPTIILVGLLIDYLSGSIARIVEFFASKIEMPEIKTRFNTILSRLLPQLTRKNVYPAIVLIFLIFSLISLSIFVAPPEGIKVQRFYKFMDNQLYEGIQWAQAYTPEDSVFAAPSLYGWWLSGFAERPTLSANEPQQLILSREFEPAEAVRNLFDTSYIVDNGLIQVREDGNYIDRHNPIFSIMPKDSFYRYSPFSFSNGEVIISYRIEGANPTQYLSQIPPKEMCIEANSEYATIILTRENQHFNSSQKTTVYRGKRFVNMSITFETDLANISLSTAEFAINARWLSDIIQKENTIALMNAFDPLFSQLVFTKNSPILTEQSKNEIGHINRLEFHYDLGGKSYAEIELFAGVFEIPYVYEDERTQENKIIDLIEDNTKSYLDKVADFPIEVFDYRKSLVDWEISYVACHDEDLIRRFVKDPLFNLVFSNDGVAIFKVQKP